MLVTLRKLMAFVLYGRLYIHLYSASHREIQTVALSVRFRSRKRWLYKIEERREGNM